MKIFFYFIFLTIFFISSTKAHSFTFDIWESGENIDTIISKARQYNKPLHRSGLIAIDTVFNPKMCVPYKKTANKYFYRENLLGEQAKITLHLTHKTMRLYMLSIEWSDINSPIERNLNESFMKILKEKHYFTHMIKIINGKYSIDFKIDENNYGSLRPIKNGIIIKYRDKKMEKFLEIEFDNSEDFKTKRKLEKIEIDKYKF